MSTRAEVCAVACAELFRDAGEIMISPMTNMASVGARLARLTFAPDILLTDGEAQLLADTPALGKTGAPNRIEGWMPFGRVFETLAWGRRHVVMGANQVLAVEYCASSFALTLPYAPDPCCDAGNRWSV